MRPPIPDTLGAWRRLACCGGFNEQRMAARLQVTTRTLQRHWRRMLPCLLESWLQEQRLIQAVHWLELTGSVKEAAFEAGYSDSAQFCRKFKQWHGVTPGQHFRRFSSQCSLWSNRQLHSSLVRLQTEARQFAEDIRKNLTRRIKVTDVPSKAPRINRWQFSSDQPHSLPRSDQTIAGSCPTAGRERSRLADSPNPPLSHQISP